jgi:general secretion pathway protein H
MRVTWGTGNDARAERARRSSSAGFTLLELLVVLAIMGLLAATLPLALNRALPGRRVAVTADRIVSALRDAQLESRIAGSRIVLEVRSGQGLTREGHVIVPAPSPLELSAVAPLGAALENLVVYPDGSLTAARVLVRDGSREKRIRITALGRVAAE